MNLGHTQEMKEELASNYHVESVNENKTFKLTHVNDLWFEKVFLFKF